MPQDRMCPPRAVHCSQQSALRASEASLQPSLPWRGGAGWDAAHALPSLLLQWGLTTKKRAGQKWSGMGWGSAVGVLFTDYCLAAISTRSQHSSALLAAENNSESASKGLPFNWAEHLPKWFLSWWVSPPRMRRIRSLPSHFFSLQCINHCKIWLIVSVLSHALHFHNGLSAHVFDNISTSLHKLADAQSIGACDMIRFRSPCSYLAVPCLQGGHGKAQMHLTWHKLL